MTPILIVPFIALTVMVIFVGVALDTKRRGQSVGSVFLLSSCVIFGTGACLGFLLTNFASPTLETWWWALAARAVWTLGGAVLLTIAIALEARGAYTLREPQVWALMAGLLLVGGLLCFNPLRDLLEGPQELQGVPELEVTRTHSGTRGGGGIWASLALRDKQDQPVELDFAGWGATTAEERLEGCALGQPVRLWVLRHVQQVLEVSCP
jgi:hypothetical protein